MSAPHFTFLSWKLFDFNTFLTSCQLLFLVTRGRIELPFAAWEAAVLAAWPTGHNSKTFGLCSLKISPVRSFLTSQASFLVHHHGLEPWTHWLRVSCSTNWANGAYFLVNKKVYKETFTERYRAIPSYSQVEVCYLHLQNWTILLTITILHRGYT